ncbi:hypothetical protein NCAS_0A11630 [Naumovozyma castellii]|uniref:Peptidase M16 N-terminal domain-containing protein n=1 Tax=Naumovozyma castellii TaxID=27288 RepID=G0V8C3_NAUCA|nr:hypothetical protein NCAS_0A11630 [Naumovozyma castellii CBS 4309]CCC67721.1 hypothetical protein NCAS_0A11630 [Naumovozyma castellii CBS 4309]
MSWQEIKDFDVPLYLPLAYSNRVHKLCLLPNGLLTLLISDPADTVTSCSLSVASGSHNDPKDIQGLAHLCEHMILAAGSKSYPDPGLYHETLSKNNGVHNAFTTGEQTTFYFEVPNVHHGGELVFDEILDIFASFFKEPLFNPLLTNKEIYAIQSEHDGNMSSVTKILYHATRMLSDPGHPFSQFSTGNMNTLASIPKLQGVNLQRTLFQYFKKNYYASKMTLCLRGPQSVNILTKYALSKFGDIKENTALTRSRFGSMSSISTKRSSKSSTENHSTKNDLESFNILEESWRQKYCDIPCFPEISKENMIFIKSSKQPTLRILFPVTDNKTRFTKGEIKIFGDLWCELFGDETKGSLCYYLVGKSWITSCYAYTSSFALGNIGLIIELTLTSTGWENSDTIIEIVLGKLVETFSEQYVHELANFMEDQNSIDLIRFLYQVPKKNPMEECSNLSELLQNDLKAPNMAYIFKGSPPITDMHEGNVGGINSEHNQEWWIDQAIKFQSFMKKFMNSSNARVILLGSLERIPELFKKEIQNTLTTEPFYEFEYKISTINLKASQSVNTYEFCIPHKNKFIPSACKGDGVLEQLFLESSLKSQYSNLHLQINSMSFENKPQLVGRNQRYEMWTLKEDLNSIMDLKSIVSFEVLSTDMKGSPENTIHLEILNQIIFTLISPQLYPAIKLGYFYEISASSKGDVQLRFTIGGFSEGILMLIEIIIKTIIFITTTPDFPSKELLRRARVLVRSNYENAAADNCVKLASLGLLIVLEENMWSLEDRIDALEDVTMASFKEFCQSFLNGSKYLTLFIQGNLSYADKINQFLNLNFTKHLDINKDTSLPLNAHTSTHILKPGTNIFAEYPGPLDDPNNSIVYFIQTGLRSDTDLCTLTSFTEYIMSLTLVPELRNKKQIGYLVMGGLRVLTDTIGVYITVMSGSEPIDLESKIDEYIAFIENGVLNRLTEATFEREYKQAYLTLLGDNNQNKGGKLSGPANLLNEIVPNVQVGSSDQLNSTSMKLHRRFRNQISDKQYNFTDEELHIDIPLIEKLTLSSYLNFFKDKISIFSPTRSKLSIMITSSMAAKDIINRKTYLQLEAFLKIKGFTIKKEKLQEIVDSADGNSSLLIKNLFNYFRSRNEGWKLCTVVLKEVVKMSITSLKQHYNWSLSTKKEDKDKSVDWNGPVSSTVELKKVARLTELPTYCISSVAN